MTRRQLESKYIEKIKSDVFDSDSYNKVIKQIHLYESEDMIRVKTHSQTIVNIQFNDTVEYIEHITFEPNRGLMRNNLLKIDASLSSRRMLAFCYNILAMQHTDKVQRLADLFSEYIHAYESLIN